MFISLALHISAIWGWWGLDKAPSLSIKVVFWVLPSDTYTDTDIIHEYGDGNAIWWGLQINDKPSSSSDHHCMHVNLVYQSSDGVNWVIASYLRPHSVFRPACAQFWEEEKSRNHPKILTWSTRKLHFQIQKEFLCIVSWKLNHNSPSSIATLNGDFLAERIVVKLFLVLHGILIWLTPTLSILLFNTDIICIHGLVLVGRKQKLLQCKQSCEGVEINFQE